MYNESENLATFVERIENLKLRLSDNTVKLLLVNDGSTDDSLEQIRSLAQRREWLSYLSFSGNFGHQAALIAGLTSLDKWPDAVLTMDSDLEHPVEVAEDLIRKWSNGEFILINAIRNDHKDLPFEKRLSSTLFYKIISLLSGVSIHPGQADFCIWDANIVRGLKDYLYHVGSLRVFAAWLPGPKTRIFYDQNLSPTRKSRFTSSKRIDLAMISILRFSNTPLKIIFWMGLLGLGVSLIHVAQIIYAVYAGEFIQPGWTTLILTIIFMGCAQLVCLSVLATYLQKLVLSKDLPLFLIKEEKEKV